jgi:hypothetical protein
MIPKSKISVIKLTKRWGSWIIHISIKNNMNKIGRYSFVFLLFRNFQGKFSDGEVFNLQVKDFESRYLFQTQ